MPNYKDTLLQLLAQHNNNLDKASEELVDDLLKNGGRGVPRHIVVYTLSLALNQISRSYRKATRKYLKNKELAPTSSMNQANPNVARYARAQKKIQKRTLGLLATWMIGNVQLGDMNKAGLLSAYKEEMTSSDGHRVNAEFYAQLAKPLNDKQLVKEYWKDHGVQILREKILNDLLAITTAHPRKVPDEARAMA